MSSGSNSLGNVRTNFNSSASLCPPTPLKKRQRASLQDREVEVMKGESLGLDAVTDILTPPPKRRRIVSPTSQQKDRYSYSDYSLKESEETFAKPSSSSSSSVVSLLKTVKPGEFLEWSNALAPSSGPQRMAPPPVEDDFVSTEGMFAGEAGKSEMSKREDIFKHEMRVRRIPEGLARQLREKREEERKNLPHFVSRAQEYQQDISEVMKDEPRIQSIVKFLGEGSLVRGFLASVIIVPKGESIEVKTQEAKQEQVIKIPHFKTARPGTGGINILKILAYELKQYIQLKDAGFPINDHYNFDEFLSQGENRALYRDSSRKDLALLDHLKTHFKDAFYRVEFVPYELNHKAMVQEYNEKARRMNPIELAVYQDELKKINHPLYQIKEMFQFAWENDIALDLQASNLRVKADKATVTVMLCDLYYKDHPFSMILTQALATFGSYSPVWDYFCPQGNLGGRENEPEAAQLLASSVAGFKKSFAWSAKV